MAYRGLRILLLIGAAAGAGAATQYKGYLETPVDITTIVLDAP